jgi:hypothetical protein
VDIIKLIEAIISLLNAIVSIEPEIAKDVQVMLDITKSIKKRYI